MCGAERAGLDVGLDRPGVCGGTQGPSLALEAHGEPCPALLGSRFRARGPSDPVPSTAACQAMGACRRGAGVPETCKAGKGSRQLRTLRR